MPYARGMLGFLGDEVQVAAVIEIPDESLGEVPLADLILAPEHPPFLADAVPQTS
jgi:hypothetical protein